jgi:putative ABC transport system permease protein
MRPPTNDLRPMPGEWLYRLLIRLYPPRFRARYGETMVEFYRDRWRAEATPNTAALIWREIAVDLVRTAIPERIMSFITRRRASRAPGAPRPPREWTMENVRQDMAYGARGLARRPAFAAVVLATIALGIGANVGIFSVANAVLLRPLSYPHAEQLVSFGHEPPQWLTSEPDFIDYRRGLRTLSGLAAYTRFQATLGATDSPERVRVVSGSRDFFPVLGVVPIVGRLFGADEYRNRHVTSVVLSYGLWIRRFAGDRSITGKTVVINGAARAVIGVMPPHFDFPEARTDAWFPLTEFNPDSLGDRNNHYLWMVGRMSPGYSLQQARADALFIAGRITHDNPAQFDPNRPLVPHLRLVRDEIVGGARPYLFTLLGAVAFVLLIACANVANLLLVRSESRRKELAVRSALGASARRLATQLLTESVLLALAGGALGLALALAADRALVILAPSSLPRIAEIGIDWRVLAYAAGTSLATGLLIGVTPALRAARTNIADVLKDGGKTTAMHGAAGGARRALVVIEVALAVTVLSGAGMLLRSLWHLEGTGMGFQPADVFTAKVALSPKGYDDARTVLFSEQLVERVRAMPGVRAASVAGWLPVVDAGGLWGLTVEGRTYGPGQSWPLAAPQQVAPGYFAAMRIPIVAGRDFAAADREGAPRVAIISETMARTLWPGEDPLGKRFKLADPSPLLTVVGVAGDLKSRGFDDTPEPTMYFPFAQSAKSAYFVPRGMALVVRVSGDPMSMAPRVQSAVHALDPTVPVSELLTLEQVVGTSVASRRFNAALLVAFALLALLLAGIGTYGVIAYGVQQRTFEIGVRIALGAGRRSVLLAVMSEGMRLCFAGLVLGLAASIAMARGIRAMLVGVSAVDLPTLWIVCAALAVVAIVASVVPARRAMRVDPLEALRQ